MLVVKSAGSFKETIMSSTLHFAKFEFLYYVVHPNGKVSVSRRISGSWIENYDEIRDSHPGCKVLEDDPRVSDSETVAEIS
jgi:hypothetical protein